MVQQTGKAYLFVIKNRCDMGGGMERKCCIASDAGYDTEKNFCERCGHPLRRVEYEMSIESKIETWILVIFFCVIAPLLIVGAIVWEIVRRIF